MRIASPIAVAGVVLGTLAAACSGSVSTTRQTRPPETVRPLGTSAGSSTAPQEAAAPTTGSPTSNAPTTTTSPGAVDPNAPEIVEPGDIPDNQVYIVFPSTDGTYSVKVPEGWARTESSGVVTFTDKYNSITLQSSSATTAPTVAAVKASGLADVSVDPTFALTDVKPVTRKAGVGVLATYEIGSAPNPVTGKKALLAVERYSFFHNGAVVTITLSGAKGADNVDPWQIVSASLTWK